MRKGKMDGEKQNDLKRTCCVHGCRKIREQESFSILLDRCQVQPCPPLMTMTFSSPFQQWHAEKTQRWALSYTFYQNPFNFMHSSLFFLR